MYDVGGDLHVLHVEDDPDFADLVSAFLERADEQMTVSIAHTASEGLAHLSRNDVECIVSDYDMPEMDGLEFLETVRESHPDLPFILFTGKGSEEIASEAIAAGVTDYLQKASGTELYELLANRIRNAVQQYRNATLAGKLDRIRTVIRDINQVLVRSQSREELDEAVCTALSQVEPYQLVWIGEYDPESETVVPRASAGKETDYLDEITITIGSEPTGRGPTGRAIRDREIAITQSIPADADFEPWVEPAADRGYLSSAAIPLLHDETLYGVLNVYCDRPEAFDEEERSLLTELGDDIAHGLHRIDRERELQRFREAAEHAGHAVCIADADGTMEYVNPAFERITGYAAEDALGQNPRLLNSGEMDDEHFEALWKTILDGETWSEEVINRRKSGELYTADQTIAPIAGESGEPTAFVAVQADITDKKERERRLRQERQRYRALLNAVPDPVFIANPEQEEIVDVNAAAVSLIGRPREELIGLAPSELHPSDEDHQRLFRDHFRLSQDAEEGRLILTEFDDGRDILVETCDGETIPVEINAGLVEIGDETYFQGVFRDVSTRRGHEREITRQNERLEEVASLVSNDLRNPLNVASGHLELAMEDTDDPHLESVESALHRMEEMIDGFLLWAQEGRAVEELEEIDIADLLNGCWENVEAEDAELVIENGGTIVADKGRVQRLFENLFRNAIDHAGPGVTVRVGQLEEADGIYLEDDGPGIPEDSRETVFDTGYSTSEEATGLGLAIVKEIVEAHDWRISVTESDDGGARIELTGVQGE